jgi:hypothetical protein
VYASNNNNYEEIASNINENDNNEQLEVNEIPTPLKYSINMSMQIERPIISEVTPKEQPIIDFRIESPAKMIPLINAEPEIPVSEENIVEPLEDE